MFFIKFFIIFSCVVNFVQLKDDYELIMKRVTCSSDVTLCTNLFCKLRPIKRNMVALSVGCHVVNPLYNIWISAIVYHRVKEYRKYIIDIDVDVCKLVTGDITSPSAMLILSLIKSQAANIVHKCSYVGNTTISNYVYKSGYFPQFLQYGDYRLDVRFYIPKSNKTISLFNVYVTIQKDINNIS